MSFSWTVALGEFWAEWPLLLIGCCTESSKNPLVLTEFDGGSDLSGLLRDEGVA